MNPAERFFKNVAPAADGSGCLIWIGSRRGGGYGQFYCNGPVSAHRWILERVIDGGIPRHLHVDHLCRNPACVRPSHLEIVTPGENVRRGLAGDRARERAALITHCPRGHEYTPENTYRNPKKPANRQCRACKRERSREWGYSKEARAWRHEYRKGSMEQCAGTTLEGLRCKLLVAREGQLYCSIHARINGQQVAA